MIDCASDEFFSDLALREDDRLSSQRTAAVRSLVWQIDWSMPDAKSAVQCRSEAVPQRLGAGGFRSQRIAESVAPVVSGVDTFCTVVKAPQGTASME